MLNSDNPNQLLSKIIASQATLVGLAKNHDAGIKEISEGRKVLDEGIQRSSSVLETQVENLNKEILFLRAVSNKIQEYVKEEIDRLTPKLSQEVEKIYQERLQDVNNNIEKNKESLIEICNNSISAIERLKETSGNSIDLLVSKSKKIDSNYFKQLGLNIVMASLVSAMVGATASYFMVQRFPTKVVIDKNNNIIIDKNSARIFKR